MKYWGVCLGRTVNPHLIGDAFMQALLTKRADVHNHSVQKRHKRVNVGPGKSICPDDLEETSSQGTSVTPESTQQKKRGRPKKNIIVSDDSETSDDFNVQDDSAEDDSDVFNGNEDEESPVASTSNSNGIHEQDCQHRLKKGDYVAVEYNGDLFPGKIIELPTNDEPGPSVDCMQKHNKFWRWPEKKDVLLYRWDDIKKAIREPKFIRRGYFSVPELDYFLS
jgi:hypothetical protein